MTIDDLLDPAHSSKPRNKLIAQVFYDMALIECYGSGARRIIKEAKELGLPELEIQEIGMRLRFIVPLAKQIKIQANNNQSTGDDSPAITTQSPTQSDDPFIRLIRLLPHVPLSSGELK